MKLQKLSLPFLAFAQATGILTYVGFVSFIMSNANRVFGPMGGFLGPAAFLLLFIISAMTTGSLALARAGFLFWEKKYKDSFTLIGWTLGWCVFYLLLVFLFLFLFK